MGTTKHENFGLADYFAKRMKNMKRTLITEEKQHNTKGKKKHSSKILNLRDCIS